MRHVCVNLPKTWLWWFGWGGVTSSDAMLPEPSLLLPLAKPYTTLPLFYFQPTQCMAFYTACLSPLSCPCAVPWELSSCHQAGGSEVISIVSRFSTWFFPVALQIFSSPSIHLGEYLRHRNLLPRTNTYRHITYSYPYIAVLGVCQLILHMVIYI